MKIELRELSDIKPYENNPGLNGEVWMPVPGYEELYEVSSHGRLRRANRSRLAPAGYVLKPRLTWDGYLRYSLFRQGKYQHIKGRTAWSPWLFLAQPHLPGRTLVIAMATAATTSSRIFVGLPRPRTRPTRNGMEAVAEPLRESGTIMRA